MYLPGALPEAWAQGAHSRCLITALNVSIVRDACPSDQIAGVAEFKIVPIGRPLISVSLSRGALGFFPPWPDFGGLRTHFLFPTMWPSCQVVRMCVSMRAHNISAWKWCISLGLLIQPPALASYCLLQLQIPNLVYLEWAKPQRAVPSLHSPELGALGRGSGRQAWFHSAFLPLPSHSHQGTQQRAWLLPFDGTGQEMGPNQSPSSEGQFKQRPQEEMRKCFSSEATVPPSTHP